MIRRLLARQAGDRREHPECIGCQEHDVARRAGDAGRIGIADEVQRVGAAGVLGEPLGVEVELAGHRVDIDVLENRPEASRGREDVGLVHRRQADGLGIAAALEVEHVVAAPAVLVVADEAPQGVGRERGLAGPRQAEEDGGIALLADVHRRVHRQDALIRKQVVHDRERRLLDLAGVHRPDDDHLHPLEVDEDRRARPGALGGGISLERRDVDDREARGEGPQVLGARAAEQVAGEDARPGGLGVDAQRPAVLRMSADEQVLAVQAALGEVGRQSRPQPVVVLLADGVVDVAPPDVRLARRLTDDELVLRRAPGMRAGAHDERALRRDQPLTLPDGCLVQRGRRQVRDDLAGANACANACAGTRRARTRRLGRGAGHCGHDSVGLLLGRSRMGSGRRASIRPAARDTGRGPMGVGFRSRGFAKC